VVIRDLFRRALSDVPGATITRNRYNLPPPSSETQAICYFLAGASRSEIQQSMVPPATCSTSHSIEFEFKFKFKSRLGRGVVVDFGERGWRRTKAHSWTIHSTEVRDRV
jgi:hypothetical protein